MDNSQSTTGTPTLARWTRDGLKNFSWSPFESIENLVITTALRDRLRTIAEAFIGGREQYHAQSIVWRRGAFLYGPAGSGKTAASRALAKALGWHHWVIPESEILDAHLWERACADAANQTRTVIVIEDIDAMVRRMDPKTFFTTLDHAMERADGTFWIATTRHAEAAPKTQIIRPGRFDDAIRIDSPNAPLRRQLLSRLLGLPDLPPAPLAAVPPPPPAPSLASAIPTTAADGTPLNEYPETEAAPSIPSDPLTDLTERSEGMSFSHFQEIRALTATLKLEGRESELVEAAASYIDDQIIAGDRYGGISDESEALEERVRNIDPRMLMAALDMSDSFRRLIEKTLGDAAANGLPGAQPGMGMDH